MTLIQKEIKAVYLGTTQVRPKAIPEAPTLASFDTTAIQSGSLGGGYGYGFGFIEGGLKFFNGGVDNGKQYCGTTTTPYDISSFTVTNKSIGNSSSWSGNACVAFNGDGSYYYVCNGSNVYKYTCSTPYDIANSSQTASYSMTYEKRFFCFGDEGKKYYVMSQSDNYIYQYNCSTPYDYSTKSVNGSYRPINQECGGFCFRPDGSTLYLACYKNSTLYRITMTTPRDITTGTVAETRGGFGSSPLGIQVLNVADKIYMFITRGYGNIYKYGQS